MPLDSAPRRDISRDYSQSRDWGSNPMSTYALSRVQGSKFKV